MTGFETEFKNLNPAQKTAVEQTDGPLLVVAGPGTGKTHLLTMRVAHILKVTDSLPSNILCLTFTDSAAQNMRQKLLEIIGDAAYNVKISTYHSFGSDIIRSYPEYFETVATERSDDERFERPIDELTKLQILQEIVEKLPYTNSLKSTMYHMGDLLQTISDLKRNLLTPDALRKLAQTNLAQIATTEQPLNTVLADVKRMPGTLEKALPLYTAAASVIKETPGDLCELAAQHLDDAIEMATQEESTKPLTKWKNAWLHKTAENTWTLTDRKLSQKLDDIATILESYSTQLSKAGLYDFDDMILRSIDALQTNDELRFNLQEKYLYILLDEFQDTNKAQFELVKLLTDNPVNEGQPNVMAVGDDDQAIYAFQGAEYSNMLDFFNSFRDTKLVNLSENYRSQQDIIETALSVAEQIDTRLENQIDTLQKTLHQASDSSAAHIERQSFDSQAAEYEWVSEKIQRLMKDGEDPNTIAVLAPKHRYLQELVPFLNQNNIAVSYEKRENILEAPVVYSLRLMSELLLALDKKDVPQINRLFPVVLSLPFWRINPAAIWEINWQLAKRDEQRSWPELAGDNKTVAEPVNFLLTLSLQVAHQPLEYILDALSGTKTVVIGEAEVFSPLKEFYFSEHKTRNDLLFYETITQLSVIRQRLRDYQAGREELLHLEDFIAFFKLYENANQPLVNTYPVAQADASVNLMTVFKSKGLEFKHVFLLSLHDDVWGASARSASNKLTLPPNLRHIRYHAADEDERKRLLYVAITRAKSNLYLSAHTAKENGKAILPLKYLHGTSSTKEQIDTQTSQTTKPRHANIKQAAELLWHQPHTNITPPLAQLLKDRLANYQMSPTHLNSFIDTEFGGPNVFLLNTLLRFPQAPSVDGEFGNAVHETLDWYLKQLKNDDNRPSESQLIKAFEQRLRRRFIPESQFDNVKARGAAALTQFIKQRGATIAKNDIGEHDFRHEGVVINHVALTGKTDRLIIDPKAKEVTVVDYKTGTGYQKWASNLKLLKYKQQLYFYKLLVENSQTFSNHKVVGLRLEFVEPNSEGTIDVLQLDYKQSEMDELQQLIAAIWSKIQHFEFQTKRTYPSNVTGSKALIADLLAAHE